LLPKAKIIRDWVLRGVVVHRCGKHNCRTPSGESASQLGKQASSEGSGLRQPLFYKPLTMLKLRQDDLDALQRSAVAAYPLECCGVLLGARAGDTREVHEVVPCLNARTDSPHNRYSIDPVELIRIQKEGRANGLEIVGIYHSHPDHPARWSPTDLEDGCWIGYSYVITGVENGKATATNSFLLAGTTQDDKKFADEELVVQ
jgi:proteasome lid subunit RPN8/RPN11